MNKMQRDEVSPAFRALSWSKLGRVFGVIFLAMLCTYIVDRLGLSQKLESKVLEWVMTESSPTPDIAIVQITNAEYNDKDFFGGRSPLNVEKLETLVGAIERSEPKAIAVDIDTSHPDFLGLHLDNSWHSPIIWERDILNEAEAGKIEPADVLGGQDRRLNSSAGIPLLQDDPEDKVTRLYTRCVDTTTTEGRKRLEPSFVFAAARAAQGQATKIAELCQNNPDPEQKFFIDWWPQSSWTVKDARDVWSTSARKEDGGQEQKVSDLSNRLVLLGGTYLDVDRHFTPLGKEPGVFVLANAIQTELDSPARAYSKRALFVWQVIAGTAFFIILHFSNFSLRKLLLFGLPIALGLTLVFSAATLSLLDAVGLQPYVHVVVANFLPMLVAVLVFDVIIEYIRGMVLPHWLESPHT